MKLPPNHRRDRKYGPGPDGPRVSLVVDECAYGPTGRCVLIDHQGRPCAVLR